MFSLSLSNRRFSDDGAFHTVCRLLHVVLNMPDTEKSMPILKYLLQ